MNRPPFYWCVNDQCPRIQFCTPFPYKDCPSCNHEGVEQP
jgi:hypothetical protein